MLTLLVNLKTTTADAPKSLDAQQSDDHTVLLTWGTPDAGTPQGYQIYRTENPNGSWGNPLVTLGGGNSYLDTTGVVGHTYAYKMRAQYAGAWSNNYSDTDPATLFTDKTVTGSATPLSGQLVRSVHLSELQTAVNMRHLLTTGSGTVTWQSVSVGNPILPSNVQQLRDEVDKVLGPPTNAYTDTLSTGLRIKAQHIFELRERVK